MELTKLTILSLWKVFKKSEKSIQTIVSSYKKAIILNFS